MWKVNSFDSSKVGTCACAYLIEVFLYQSGFMVNKENKYFSDVDCSCKHCWKHWRWTLCLSLLKGRAQHVHEGLLNLPCLPINCPSRAFLWIWLTPGCLWWRCTRGGCSQRWVDQMHRWSFKESLQRKLSPKTCQIFQKKPVNSFRLLPRPAAPPWFRPWKDSPKRSYWNG